MPRSDVKPGHAKHYNIEDFAQLQRYNRRLAFQKGRKTPDKKMAGTIESATVGTLGEAVFGLMSLGTRWPAL